MRCTQGSCRTHPVVIGIRVDRKGGRGHAAISIPILILLTTAIDLEELRPPQRAHLLITILLEEHALLLLVIIILILLLFAIAPFSLLRPYPSECASLALVLAIKLTFQARQAAA